MALLLTLYVPLFIYSLLSISFLSLFLFLPPAPFFRSPLSPPPNTITVVALHELYRSTLLVGSHANGQGYCESHVRLSSFPLSPFLSSAPLPSLSPSFTLPLPLFLIFLLKLTFYRDC